MMWSLDTANLHEVRCVSDSNDKNDCGEPRRTLQGEKWQYRMAYGILRQDVLITRGAARR